MISAVKYKRPKSKVHKTAIDQMVDLRTEILDYNSAFDFITRCEKLTGVIGLDKVINWNVM